MNGALPQALGTVVFPGVLRIQMCCPTRNVLVKLRGAFSLTKAHPRKHFLRTKAGLDG